MTTDPTLDLDGAAAIPRSNGEPVFSAPWQSRAFGMAMVLHEQGAFDWEDFRVCLIAEIERRESEAAEPAALGDDDGSLYYSCWLTALAGVLADSDLVPAAELDTRSAEYSSGARDHVH
jgi:nitrile hydratase accessory protein